MTRLQSELLRLYLTRSPVDVTDAAQASALIGPVDRVRALVMELTRPPSWEILARVWHGVQTELDLPAPGIAVSGVDGLQLWFSIAEPIPAARAQAFLQRLKARFLPDLDATRLRLMPASNASALQPERQARLVPALQEPSGNWSAFVAPDLAPIFSETPWLDIPPSDEGQATLLRGLKVAKQTEFEAAWIALTPAVLVPDEPGPAVRGFDDLSAWEQAHHATEAMDPRQFLLRVMNDGSVALALRIEAAKALLAHPGPPQP